MAKEGRGNHVQETGLFLFEFDGGEYITWVYLEPNHFGLTNLHDNTSFKFFSRHYQINIRSCL